MIPQCFYINTSIWKMKQNQNQPENNQVNNILPNFNTVLQKLEHFYAGDSQTCWQMWTKETTYKIVSETHTVQAYLIVFIFAARYRVDSNCHPTWFMETCDFQCSNSPTCVSATLKNCSNSFQLHFYCRFLDTGKLMHRPCTDFNCESNDFI